MLLELVVTGKEISWHKLWLSTNQLWHLVGKLLGKYSRGGLNCEFEYWLYL